MEQRFLEIKNAYDSLYKQMLSQGRLTWKPTEKGYWGMSVCEEVFELFRRIGLSKEHKLVDLGSGDGKVPIIGSVFGAECTGIECDDELHGIAENMKQKLGVQNVNFVKGDFLQHNLSSYGIVFLHPDQKMTVLEQKLLRELNGHLLVYGPHYHPLSLHNTAKLDIFGQLVFAFQRQSQHPNKVQSKEEHAQQSTIQNKIQNNQTVVKIEKMQTQQFAQTPR